MQAASFFSFSLSHTIYKSSITFLQERRPVSPFPTNPSVLSQFFSKGMSLQMASIKLSYHRLESADDAEVREQDVYGEKPVRGRLRRKRSWWRLRRLSRGRPRIRIPSLRRFSRRKARQLSSSWIKVWKRLKESRSYMGDLFAGNYLFMQVSPSSLGCVEKTFMGHDQHGKYPLPRVHV